MLSINTLSLSPNVNDWLENSRLPRIMHVFDYACNLINEHSEILSIVTAQIGNGPFNLVIEDEIRFSDHLSLESAASISPTQLNLGDLTISLADAKLWSPRPHWEILHAKRAEILHKIISLRGAQRRSNSYHDEGIASGWLSMESISTTALATTLPVPHYQSLISDLSSALVDMDIPSALKVTSHLAGLGIGLTPSGDDFILGALYASWIIHPCEIASVLAREITKTAAPLTTSLSAAWLKSAGKGETGILWHELFNALLVGNTFDIQLKIAKLLSVGYTSGAEALAGFIGTFQYWEGIARAKIS